MLIRTAVPADAAALAEVEALCFPAAEAAPEQQFRDRLQAYAGHFWLMFDGETLISFVDGMVTDQPDLTDDLYENAALHSETGAWQMIFGVDVAPVYQHRGCASYLLRQVILDAAQAGRKGLVLTCKERLVDFYARLGFVDEGLSESTHGNVVWHQMRLALTHAVGTGNPTANGSAKTAERTNDADTTAMSGVDHDTETLEFPQVEPTA